MEEDDDEEEAKRAEALEERRFKRKLDRKRGLLELIRQCQTLPESERRDDPFSGIGSVYLRQKYKSTRVREGILVRNIRLPTEIYKIGKTDDYRRRSKELFKKRLHPIAHYLTPVPLSLERKLHDYFDRYRIQCPGEKQKGQRKNLSGELFRLPVVEVEAFKTTVANIEKWVLLAEEALLELQIMRMEAHGRASEQ